MRVSHGVSAVFDDPNLVSCAGLAPVLALAERCGLHRLVADTVTVSGPGSANAAVKVPALVAGMVAGADSIDDMDLLRHGGMGRLFGGVRAPSTLGSFLRSFRFGHVRQLDRVAAGLLVNLAGHTPLLSDADQMVLVDVDDTVKATFGYAKQGAGYGYSKVKGLNALLGIVSTPTSAPVIAATRLRKGSVNSARGAARLVADTLATAKRCGATGLVLTRADSAFYNADVVAAISRGGSRFSIIARMDPAVTAAIASIPDPNCGADAVVGSWLGRTHRPLGWRVRSSVPPPRRVSGVGGGTGQAGAVGADAFDHPRQGHRRCAEQPMTLVASRNHMNSERTAAVNALTALLRVADLGIDARRPLTDSQITTAAAWRSRDEGLATATAHAEAIRLAKRVTTLEEELKTNTKRVTELVNNSPAQQLLNQPGIGPVTAAVALTASSHPGRVRSEAAFASLAGVNPIPASSGNTVRHRLNRGGDRR